jgi:hypothetical protein
MGPLIWLWDMSIRWRRWRSEMQGGTWPVMFSAARSRATTRSMWRVPQDTPCQSQNESDSSLHESKACVWPVRCDLRHKRACRSDSDELWKLGVAKEHVKLHKVTKQMSIVAWSMDMYWAPTIAILLGCFVGLGLMILKVLHANLI